MSSIDWFILIFTLAAIVVYGIYKSKTSKNLEGYFLSNRSLPWYLVLLSIMGTQASAITFLTGPGPGIQRRNAFCAILFWPSAGDDRDQYFLCACFLPG